jgi:hypothetical protein
MNAPCPPPPDIDRYVLWWPRSAHGLNEMDTQVDTKPTSTKKDRRV